MPRLRGGREIVNIHRNARKSAKVSNSVGVGAKAKLFPAVARVAGGLIAIAGMGRVAGAQTLYWDGDGLGTVGGGSGQWDTTLLRWGTTPTSTSFVPFVNGDTAVFGGTGGDVNITTSIVTNFDF